MAITCTADEEPNTLNASWSKADESREECSTQQEGRDAQGVSFEGRSDAFHVCPPSAQNPAVGVAGQQFASRRVYKWCRLVSDGAQVAADDEVGHQLHEEAHDRLQRTQPTGERHLSSGVTVEHLQAAHHQGLGLEESVPQPQRLLGRQLEDDLAVRRVARSRPWSTRSAWSESVLRRL